MQNPSRGRNVPSLQAVLVQRSMVGGEAKRSIFGAELSGISEHQLKGNEHSG